MPRIRRLTAVISLAVVGAVVLMPTRGSTELRSEDLTIIRSVTERDWLNLKLELLGLRLSYPAYRVSLYLNQSNVIAFDFFLSAPLAQHLEESGRGESERVLSYHAEGILNQVMTLLREEFPELWPGFDSRGDFSGIFLKPGEEFDALPEEVAVWRKDRLKWRD